MLQINKLITLGKVNKYVASEEYRKAFTIIAECDGEGFILTQNVLQLCVIICCLV